jgi:3-phosphoshikimate 1-carboxyvinyltransferase
MTAGVLKSFGVSVNQTPDGYFIAGSQRYAGTPYTVEGDFSHAAFFACAAAINGDISMENLTFPSLQGDVEIIEILRKFGADVRFDGGILMVKKGAELRGVSIDASQIPDLIPALSAAAAYASGETVIYNAGRLRLKESDRIKSTCAMLASIGASVRETSDGMAITGSGGKKLPGGFARSFGDHRIAMSAAVLAAGTQNGVTVDDCGCISKSYPMFLRDFGRL